MDMKTQFLDYSGLGETVNLIKKCIADHKEILPYASLGSFPKIGNEDCLYIDISSGLFYRWNSNGKQYILLGGKSVKEVSIESGSTNGTIKLIVDGVKTDNIAIKGLGAAAFIDNYAGSTVPGGPATNAMDIASQTPILATAREKNEISVKANANGNLSNISRLASIISALDFKWYDSHWQIGNIRGDSTNSNGFGIVFTPDGEDYSNYIYIDTSAVIHGNLAGNASSASSVPWSGVQDKPSTFSPSSHSHVISDITALQTTLDSKLSRNGGHMAGTANIVWEDSGYWNISNEGVTFPVKRGGLEWYGQSDAVKLYAVETGSDNLELILEFQDDNSNGLSIRNSKNEQTARISATGDITATSFVGPLSGNASSATALTSSAGSATQPIYFSGGKPVACTYTLGKSVPSNAVFTDTNTWRGIQNTLTSDSTSDSLSAAQGKVLKSLVDGKAASNHNHDSVYSKLGHTHSYLPLSGSLIANPNANNFSLSNAMSGYLLFSNTGDTNGTALGIGGVNGATDGWTIRGYQTANNEGCLEIAVGDDGDEGIYIRQYTSGQYKLPFMNKAGSASGLNYREIVLMEPSTGNSKFPGTVSASAFSGPLNGNATSATTASSCSGNSATASALTTSSGSNVNPVYFYNGVPVTCAYKLNANISAYSGSLSSGGWAALNGRGNSPSITVAYNNSAAAWNSSTYSSTMVWGDSDTRGMIDCAYNSPAVSFGGASFRNSTDDNPAWYFKLSGTSGSSYDLNSMPYAQNAATSTYANYINLVAANEIRFNNKPSNAIDLCFGYKWADGSQDALISSYRFYNGGGDLTQVTASQFNGNLNGTATNTEYVGNDSQYMRFHWSGQGGQPTWLWGGNEAGNMYVYNPSNFSVNYANSSGSSSWLNTNSSLNYGASGLQYFNQSTSTTSGAGNNANPSNDWYHIIRMNHANGAGYYVDLAFCFHSNTVAYRRIAGGTESAWVYLIDSSNISTQSVNYANSAGSVAWGNVSGRPSSLPASDVYSWAKASTKPSYSYTEITDRPTLIKAVSKNGYWGMADHDGSDSNWIRTTTAGIIPYQSGGAGAGHCGIGTSSWYFSNAYIDTVNCVNASVSGHIDAGGFIQSHNIINTTYEYQSNRGSVDWRFGAATGTGDENFFGFYDAKTGKIPLALDGNFGNIYVGFNVGSYESPTAVGVYLGAQVAGNRAFIYNGDSYQGSIWIQTRLDGSWKWFSLGRACSTALSDIRLKGDIRDTEVQDATKVIEAMQIRSFERKDSHKKYKIGFIADELEQLDPNLVDGGGEIDGHPNYKSVNNLQMLAYVVKAMQELNSKVNILEQENKQLKQKLNMCN